MIISNINRKYCLINVTSSSRCSSRSLRSGAREGGKDGRGTRGGWVGVRADSPRHLGRQWGGRRGQERRSSSAGQSNGFQVVARGRGRVVSGLREKRAGRGGKPRRRAEGDGDGDGGGGERKSRTAVSAIISGNQPRSLPCALLYVRARLLAVHTHANTYVHTGIARVMDEARLSTSTLSYRRVCQVLSYDVELRCTEG